MESTYFAKATLVKLNFEVNRHGINQFVLRFQNFDGGFGGQGHSTLASTYYAIKTLNLIGYQSPHLGRVATYLSAREQDWDIQYLEHLFWLMGGLKALDMSVHQKERAERFVLDCQHPSGGFARSRNIGIATLEYTHYAVKILKYMAVI
ncbi:MAG: hypothetical protein HY664_05420 [Chloroflexi bacterium]|nr:hypothetical protein [Chloroflexota bacterium]